MLHRARPVLVMVALAAPLLQGGCRNACQDLCVRLAAYAEDCGYPVPESEVDACIDDQASAPDTKVCRDFGDAETIRNEWTCDDLAAYGVYDLATEAR